MPGSRDARRSSGLLARCIGVLVLVALPAVALHGDAEVPQAALFLSSVPINAEVVMDGQRLEARTPLLLRAVAPGKHGFLVSAEGFPPQVLELELEAGEVRTLGVDLAAAFLRMAFPEEATVVLAGTEELAPQRLFQVPQGRYSLRREDGALALEPEYPGEGWIRGLTLSLPLSLAFAAVLTAHDVYYPKRLGLSLGPTLSLSPATLSAYGVSLAVGAFDLALLASRARFRRSFSYTVVPVERSLAAAREYYDKGEGFLSLGQLEEALRMYAAVMEEFPDSLLSAEALFKSARIHFLTGQDDLAIVELTLVVDRYPLPDLYDKARKNLADLLLRRRSYEQCLEQLAAMVFPDPQYSREEVDLFAAEVLEAWFASDATVLPRLVEAYEVLAEGYPGSSGRGLYLYRLAYYLHLADRDAEAAAALDRIPVQQQETALQERIEALRRSLSAGG
jgi:tetratricopeptide (TPR) repeat protein